jgi:hypothetical protein
LEVFALKIVLAGTQRFGAGQLFVAAGCDNHFGSQGRRQLQTKNGDASRSLNQNRLTRFQLSLLYQRIPRGECRNRESRSLLVTQVIGFGNSSLFVEHNVLGQYTRDRISQCMNRVVEMTLPVEPPRGVMTYDSVARAKARYVSTDFHYFSGSVRHQNHRKTHVRIMKSVV